MARETGRNAANGGTGFKINRRGFLGSTGLAAMGAIIGNAVSLSSNAQAFPAPTRKPAALPHPPSRRDRNI